VVARVVGLLVTVGVAWAAAAAGTAAGIVGCGALAIFAIIQLSGLVRYTERTPRELLRFFEGLRYDDLTVQVQAGGRGAVFDAIAEGFAEVSDAFRRLRSEREEQGHVLQTVVRHVGVALIAFRGDGEVILFNPAAKRLLGLPRLRRMSHLARHDRHLADALGRLRAGERMLLRLERGDRSLDLAVHAAQFLLGNEQHTLVSLQDIRQELEEREMEAWQQLTRVLTHEIVNSVTPIASLAGTAMDLLGPEAEVPGSVCEALTTIEHRSRGLIRFVESYRSLTHVPTPNFELVSAAELFQNVRILLGTALRKNDIALDIAIEPDTLEVAADPELIEQVLINLMLNAIEALAGREDGWIRLRARIAETGRPLIEVADNGPGIEPEVRDRIFVPFFSTKTTGSGIGLSLSRQILRLHGGTLTVRSTPDVETIFTMRF
jgi:two-component system, NtrC family, nitrogen regulation sensor histidine kinase NtrY